MSDHLLPIPLTERSVHLCVDMQRLFSADGPWPTPWMDKVSAGGRGAREPPSRENHLHPIHSARASRTNARHVATLLRALARGDPGLLRQYLA